MATFKCLECTHPVSSEIDNCPECGADVSAMIKKVMAKSRAGMSAPRKRSAPWLREIKRIVGPYFTKRNQISVALFVIAIGVIGLLRLLLIDTHSDMFAATSGVSRVDTTGMNHPVPVPRAKTSKAGSQFSGWDGSHRHLTKRIRAQMNDSESYEHVQTSHRTAGNNIVIVTRFRGKNAFGALVLDTACGMASKSGNGSDVRIIPCD